MQLCKSQKALAGAELVPGVLLGVGVREGVGGYKIVLQPEKNQAGEASGRNRITHSHSSLGRHPGELQAMSRDLYTNAHKSPRWRQCKRLDRIGAWAGTPTSQGSLGLGLAARGRGPGR